MKYAVRSDDACPCPRGSRRKDLPSPQVSHHSGQPCHTSATPPMVWLRSGVCPPLYGTFPPRGIHTIGYLSEMLQLRSVHVHQVLRILLRKGYLAQTYASDISAGPRWILTPAGRLLPKLHTVIKRYGSLGQILQKVERHAIVPFGSWSLSLERPVQPWQHHGILLGLIMGKWELDHSASPLRGLASAGIPALP